MALIFHMPITLGQASIGVAFIIVLVDIILRELLGWGTIANMIFIGVWVDALRPYVPSVPNLFSIQVAYLLFGTLLMGFATAIYVGVNAGAGPRDSLMLAISRLSKTSLLRRSHLHRSHRRCCRMVAGRTRVAWHTYCSYSNRPSGSIGIRSTESPNKRVSYD